VSGARGRSIAAGVLLGAWLSQAGAQAIYTCVDSKGRRLTADRPIVDCIDREQKELNPSGTVKRKLPPSPTLEERIAEEERARQAQRERNRLAEEKRRTRALVARYPHKAAHDKERTEALAGVDAVIVTANRRLVTLQAERQRLDTELEFYRKDPTRIPAPLKRQLEENERQVAEQRRFIASQNGEKDRVNARFDEELALLRQLWVTPDPVKAGVALKAASGPAR
jgi:Domain of unknown function (DUF4124)